jgi:hypothetical protein
MYPPLCLKLCLCLRLSLYHANAQKTEEEFVANRTWEMKPIALVEPLRIPPPPGKRRECRAFLLAAAIFLLFKAATVVVVTVELVALALDVVALLLLPLPLLLEEEEEEEEEEALTALSFPKSNPSLESCTPTALPEMSPTLFSHSGSQATASGVEHAMDFPNGTVLYASWPFSNPVTKCSSKIDLNK